MPRDGNESLIDRVKRLILKPVDPDAAVPVAASKAQQNLDEAREAELFADDKERLIGLIAAPLAAIVGILVISALIDNDPSQYLKSGAINTRHVSVGLYHSLTLVILGLCVAMIVTSLLRKRMYMGIVFALFGLAIFNLHYWGFGVPFLMVGAYFLVRAYRLQQQVKLLENGAGPDGRPRRNNRYTPPTN